MKSAILSLAFCVSLPVFAPAAPLYSDSLTFEGYPAGLNDGQVYVGLSQYQTGQSSAYYPVVGTEFLAWCIIRGVPQAGFGQSFDVNVYALDDPDLHALLPATHQQLRIQAFLGLNFANTNPNDAEVHHGIWEQLRPAYYDLNASEQARVDAAAIFTAIPPGDPAYFSTANFLVAMPVGWGTAQSFGQPIMWEGGGTVPGEHVVPEPSTMALLGGGMLFLVLRRRR